MKNHPVYKLSSGACQAVLMLCLRHSVHTSGLSSHIQTTRRSKALWPCSIFSSGVRWVGAFTWFSKKWFFASFQRLWCVAHKKIDFSGRLLTYYAHRVGGIILVATEGNMDKWMAVPLLKVWFCCHLHEMAHQIEFEDHPGVFQAEISSKTARASFKSNM